MPETVLVLGAQGRFGRHATAAFAAAGWRVRALVRPGRDGPVGADCVHADAADTAALARAAEGADVIVHALNPPYPAWAREVPRLTAAVLAATEASGATLLIPGNVYVFGRELPEVLTPATPHAATAGKPLIRAEMEAAVRAAAEAGRVRAIILRGGDFIEAEATGGWFDGQIARRARAGVIRYPGPLDLPHAWAYLPDMARAAAALAARRAELPAFADIGFPGWTLTGAELIGHVEAAAGRPLRRKPFPWPMLRLAALVSPLVREVLEMRYLWDRPHRIDAGSLRAVLPEFEGTPPAEGLARSLPAG